MSSWRKCGHEVFGSEQECLRCRIAELEHQITEIPTLCRRYEKRIAEYERQWNDLLAVSRQADKLNREMYPQFREQK